MGIKQYKLGNLIERLYNKNSRGEYGVDDVRGVSNLKAMMKTKADLTGRDLTKFSVVFPNEFVFNHRTSRNGSKFSITQNYDDVPHIFTEDYVVFRVRKDCESIIDHNWLYLYFNRDEFDRFVITNSWGSSTEFYNWEDICDIDIELPDLPTQQKFVNVYKAMLENQKAYENGLSDLKLTCDAYIEDLRRKIPCERIGSYILQKNDRNTDKTIETVMGLSTKKEFRVPQSRVNVNELANYKIVLPDEVAFVPTTDSWKVLAFAINENDFPIVVSPIYEVFSLDKFKLRPQYLAMWLCREEFDRYARFNSWGSARENFTFSDMQNVSIPIPGVDVQDAIIDIYRAYITRKNINERLKNQIKYLCPILIRGSIEEALKEA